MATEILFEEIQGAKGKGVKRFFKIATGIIVVAAITSLIFYKGRENQLIILLSVAGLISIGIGLFPAFALTTQLKTDGVYLKFPPMQLRFTRYAWEDIAEAYIRNYDAVQEYAGLGIKVSPAGIGYVLTGNTGLQLILKNGTKILVTTKKPEELEKVLKILRP